MQKQTLVKEFLCGDYGLES